MSLKVRDRLASSLKQGFVLPLALILILVVLITLVFGIIKFSTRTQAAAEKPNIVVIETDDQRWDTLGYMPIVQSRLVGQGINFTNGFVTTSLCCPSRASFLTGLYAHNHKLTSNVPPQGGAEVFKDGSTIAVWLKSAGYKTSLVGKYMNGYENLTAGYIPPGWDDWHAWAGGRLYYDYKLSENGVVNSFGSAESDYATDVLRNRAVSFIQSQASSTQPFFLWFTPTSPHQDGGYPPKVAPRHALTCQKITFRPPSYNEADVSDKAPWVQAIEPITPTQSSNTDGFIKSQVCALKAIDEAVDAIMNALGPKLDNTIIVFTTDNGFMWGEHRVRTRKNCEFDECARVPFVIRYPKLIGLPVSTPVSPITPPATPSATPALMAPTSLDKFVLNIDLPSTFAELAGVVPPTKVDGKSLVPLLTDPVNAPWRTDFLMQYGLNNFIVRNKDWMYAELAGGYKQLYDMTNDPYQLVSQHANPAYKSIMAQLATRLAQLKTE